jgi:hypothetical protein
VNKIDKVVSALLGSSARSAVLFLDSKTVVRATHRHRPRKRARRVEFVLTIGQPNHREREFIRQCVRAGERMPVRKVQLRHWPKAK